MGEERQYNGSREMKTIILRLLVMSCLLATGFSAEAGIYLLYDEVTGAPASIINDTNNVADEQDGYVSSRAHIWSRSPNLSPVNPAFPAASAYGNSMVIPSIILFAPSATRSPELSHVLQGSHAWSSYQAGNNATGLGLVYSPNYGANLSPSQKSARGNRSRAQAFRLDYYK